MTEQTKAEPEPPVPAVTPEKYNVNVSIKSLPGPLLTALEDLKKRPEPMSAWKTIFKDILPVLTPIAALFVSWVAFYYANEFNARKSASESSETLGKLISEVGQKTDDRTKTIEAMKLAAYGDQVLPAVKIVLGADDPDLRDGGVQVAKQIYLAETMDRGKLTDEMQKYYDNPFLRLGALEWFADVESESRLPLSDKASRVLFCKLKKNFGTNAERCTEQGEDLSLAAAQFLSAWAARDSNDFVKGMKEHCSRSFVGVHKELDKITDFK